MKSIAPKTTGSSYTAAEFEDRDTELENSVIKSGQTLTEAKNTQLSRSMNINGIAAQSYQDSGSANSIELTPITGSSGLVVPDAYAQLNGGIVEFNKTVANTSTTVTVNIGQTAGGFLGAKNLKRLDGTNPSIGEVVGYLRIYFNSSADEWRLLSTVGTSFLSQPLTGNYSIPTPETTSRFLNVDASGGDVTITFPTAVAGDKTKQIAVYKSVSTANDVLLTGLFTQNYILRDFEVLFATVQEVTTGVYAWVVQSQDSQTKLILEQQDFNSSILQPDSTKLFEFSSPNLTDSDYVLPFALLNLFHLQAGDSNAKFPNRGVLQLTTGYLLYSYSWGNTGFIKLRIKPNFDYTIANNAYFIDSRSGNTNVDNRLIFFYSSSNDQITFFINDDGTNNIQIASNAFTSNPSLQTWFDIVITWDKSGNDASMFIDGVEQGGGAEGTKTVNGTGITNIDLTTSDELAIGVENSSTNPYTMVTNTANFYFIDWLFGNTFDEVTTNHDGSGSVKPYFNYNRVGHKDHNGLIDNDGNAGLRNLFLQNLYFLGSSIFGDIEFKNNITYQSRNIGTNNFLNSSSSSRGAIYDALTLFIKNINDKIQLSGGLFDNTSLSTMILSYAERISTTQIVLYGFDPNDNDIHQITVSSGSGLVVKVSMSW